MTDKDFLYCAADNFYKSVGGAALINQAIVFKVKLSRKFFAYNIFMIIKGENFDSRLKLKWDFFDRGFDTYLTEFKANSAGIYKYHFEIDIFGNYYRAGCGELLQADLNQDSPPYQLTVCQPNYYPDWIKGGIIYHVFVDRFAKIDIPFKKRDNCIYKQWNDALDYKSTSDGKILNNDFYGGNLKGIISKLDYLKSLNIDAIYLSPIFEASSNHRYDTGDYFKTDSLLGSEKDFLQLIKKAKKIGISIIIDGVFNHTGSDSVYFNKYNNYNSIGAYQSKLSQYYNWYDFKHFPDDYKCWWGIKTLPSIKKDCQDFQNFIAKSGGVLEKWITLGVAGIRLDVADELSDTFIETIRQKITSTNPEAFLIGEVWEDASNKVAYGHQKKYFLGKQLHSVTNYPFMRAVITYVVTGNSTRFAHVIEVLWENYPRDAAHSLMNIIGTHDTRRIITELADIQIPATRDERALYKLSTSDKSLAVNRLKIAALLQYTLYGVPCVYYGDEAGLEGFEDPFNRKTFPWENLDQVILQWYKCLGKLRKKSQVFKKGAYKTLYSQHGIFIFERFSADEKIVVGVNCGQSEIKFDAKNYICMFNNQKCGIISLLPKSYFVIKKINSLPIN